MWLAGHVAEDADTTRKLHTSLLAMHCTAVRPLVEVNAKILGTTP